MEDYKPNSNRFKEEQKNKAAAKTPEKKVEKVVTGKVVTVKKSPFRKFFDEFISEDAKNVKTYVLGEVLIPSIKKAIVDIAIDSVNMIFYGGTRGNGKRSTADTVSYRSYYGGDRRPASTSRYSSTTARYDCDDVKLSSRGEAEDVLARMDELMDQYGLVRVADFYDLVGVACDYTANKYGWTNIRNANIDRTRDGFYVIRMPRAIPID